MCFSSEFLCALKSRKRTTIRKVTLKKIKFTFQFIRDILMTFSSILFCFLQKKKKIIFDIHFLIVNFVGVVILI